MSNTLEPIRPMNGIALSVRLVRPVQLVKQSFMSGTAGEVQGYICNVYVYQDLSTDGFINKILSRHIVDWENDT